MNQATRIVYLISDWPEELGKKYEVTEVRPDETDDVAISRARELYSPGAEFVIQ